RSVLRSAIREYLCCEAMHGLGIPTTRALCLVGSDDKVYREQVETGATIVRMAPSHVRFGTFEIFYYRKQHEHLQRLADYVIDMHFPDFAQAADKYVRFFAAVVERTAKLIAQWQAVGWSHGVLNTDNMSILGLTLDYGPYGFMDDYDPGFICNHSDYNGRYAFNQQPYIGLWNLSCLAQTLLPFAPKEELKAVLDGYQVTVDRYYRDHMRMKLGLREDRTEDEALLQELKSLMVGSRVDYTIFWRELGTFSSDPAAKNERLREHFLNPDRFDAWAGQYRERLRSEESRDDERRAGMDRVNPKYVLRNYLAQGAIEKAQQKDYAEIDRLLNLLRDPYTDHPGMDSYAAAPPNWGKHLSVSCSS
ncbi:MAG TPA: YdiU family protein, partial [Nitrospira sp.]|nr:YdiU family protein [Nitrospira sp.]